MSVYIYLGFTACFVCMQLVKKSTFNQLDREDDNNRSENDLDLMILRLASCPWNFSDFAMLCRASMVASRSCYSAKGNS
jgi:hypothetical protein